MVKRYDVESDPDDGPCSMWNVESEDGEFVEYEDYAKLECKYEELAAENAKMKSSIPVIQAQGVEMVMEYHKKRAEALYDVDRKGSQRHASALCDAIDIAAQLRKEASNEH